MLHTHWRYLTYLVRHKWFVFVAGRKTGAPLWRLLIHDWSKFTRSEWFAYSTFFYAPKPSGMPTDALGRPNAEANRQAMLDERKAAFDRAWLRHQHLNKHHWQHHILREDSGMTKALPIPEPLVREMVADWAGAGRAITGKWDVQAWYRANREKMLLHPATSDRVDHILVSLTERK